MFPALGDVAVELSLVLDRANRVIDPHVEGRLSSDLIIVLGLENTVYAHGLTEPTTLADVVGSLCHAPVVVFEHMFEMGAR